MKFMCKEFKTLVVLGWKMHVCPVAVCTCSGGYIWLQMVICWPSCLSLQKNPWTLVQMKQGKSEGFDSCEQPSKFTQIGFKSLKPSLNSKPSVNSNWSYNPETLNSGQNRGFFVLCNLEIWRMTLKNNRSSLLYYFKLCGSFRSHRSIQTWVRVRKRQIWVKICDFFVLCGLEMWRMSLKNSKAPLLCYFKLCASFPSHWSIQTGVTVQKRQNRVKISDFLSCVTLKFDGWPSKTIGHLFYVTSSFVHHFIAIGQFKLELQSGNTKFESKLEIFYPMWPWNLTHDLEKQ